MRRFAVVSLATIVALVTLGFSVELLRSHFVANDVGANYVTLPFSVVLFTLLIATVMSVRRPSTSAALLLAGAAGAGVGAWRFSTHPWCAAVGFVVAFSTALLPLHAAVVYGAGVPRTVRRMFGRRARRALRARADHGHDRAERGTRSLVRRRRRPTARAQRVLALAFGQHGTRRATCVVVRVARRVECGRRVSSREQPPNSAPRAPRRSARRRGRRRVGTRRGDLSCVHVPLPHSRRPLPAQRLRDRCHPARRHGRDRGDARVGRARTAAPRTGTRRHDRDPRHRTGR